MQTIRIRKHLVSQVVDLPEAASLVGKDVDIVITEREPVAAVVRPQFGSAKGLIQMADDFDAPLDDFREYTE